MTQQRLPGLIERPPPAPGLIHQHNLAVGLLVDALDVLEVVKQREQWPSYISLFGRIVTLLNMDMLTEPESTLTEMIARVRDTYQPAQPDNPPGG